MIASRRGIALPLVFGVLVVAAVIAFSLISFSRENRFAIRRFYLTVQADVLLQGAVDEAAAYLAAGFLESGDIPELRQFLDDPAATWEQLSSLTLELPLPHSRTLAAELDLTLSATLGFEKVRPFFQPPPPADPATGAQIVPDAKECHGWAVFYLTVTHPDFTREAMVKQAFKIVHLLPPVLPKFTLFVRDQDPEAAGKGSPRHVNNLYLDAVTYLCRGVMAENARAKPLRLVHTWADLDTEGSALPAGVPRSFDSSGAPAALLRKGWVHLGTPAPEGFVLNLASGQIYDYLGAKVNSALYPDDLGQRYVGERFQNADVAELMATTFTGGGTVLKTATFDNSGPSFPAAIPAAPMAGIPSVRFKLTFFDFLSVDKDIEHGLPGLGAYKHVFENYHAATASAVGYESEDYRSQHASLLHLFGSEHLDAARYYDSRSPTLALGPIRRKFFAVGSVRQESDYDRGTASSPEPFQHPASAAQPKTVVLPWFDIDAAGQNRSTRLPFTDATWNQIDESDPAAGVPPALPGLFQRRTWYVTEIFSPTPPLQTYYRNLAMSRFFEEPAILSVDTIFANNVTKPPRGGIYSKRIFAEPAARAALVTLARAGGAQKDEAFFYDTQGGLYTASALELRGAKLQDAADPASAWLPDSTRILFRGNLRGLQPYSAGFQLAAPGAAPYDLRRKVTHVFPTLAEFRAAIVDESAAGAWKLALDGDVIYVAEDAPATLGAPGRDIVVSGPGMLIFQGPLTLASSLRVASEPVAVARQTRSLPPVTLVSIGGAITVNAPEVHASLVALDPANGTLRRGEGAAGLRIVGSVAVDHLELGDGHLRETTPPGNGYGNCTFEVGAGNLFARAGDWERLEVIYNDALEPTLWESYRKHYRFRSGRQVSVR